MPLQRFDTIQDTRWAEVGSYLRGIHCIIAVVAVLVMVRTAHEAGAESEMRLWYGKHRKERKSELGFELALHGLSSAKESRRLREGRRSDDGGHTLFA